MKLTGMLKATGYVSENLEFRFLEIVLRVMEALDISIDQPADEDVKQYHKSHSQRADLRIISSYTSHMRQITYEEPHLLLGRLFLAHKVAEDANTIKQEQSAQTHCSI